jgi:hypothetical protein
MRKVYILNECGTDRYKVGFTSKDVSKRIKSLQAGNGSLLENVYEFESDESFVIERVIHRYLATKKLVGEWFCLTEEELMEVRDTIMLTHYNIKMMRETSTLGKKLKF